MSSSSFSSSSSSLSSADSPPSFPSSASAISRQRRKRRDAISRAAESEWDASPSTTAPPPQTITIPPWRRADELICPLSPSDAPLPPYALLPCFAPFTPTTPSEDEADELQ